MPILDETGAHTSGSEDETLDHRSDVGAHTSGSDIDDHESGADGRANTIHGVSGKDSLTTTQVGQDTKSSRAVDTE